MFLSKQFRNFVHSKSVYTVFRDCIFEVIRANSVQISFSTLKFLRKVRCTSTIKLALLALEHERFFAKVSANRLLRHK